MTVNEFNIKYFKYLEEGHYGLDINDPETINFLDKEFEEFIKIPGFEYSQIKLKFGTSRFYTNLPHEENLRIERAIDSILKNKEHG